MNKSEQDVLWEKLGPVHDMAVDIALTVYGSEIGPATSVVVLAMSIGFILACAKGDGGWADEGAKTLVPGIVQRMLQDVPSDYLDCMRAARAAAALQDINVAGNA